MKEWSPNRSFTEHFFLALNPLYTLSRRLSSSRGRLFLCLSKFQRFSQVPVFCFGSFDISVPINLRLRGENRTKYNYIGWKQGSDCQFFDYFLWLLFYKKVSPWHFSFSPKKKILTNLIISVIIKMEISIDLSYGSSGSCKKRRTLPYKWERLKRRTLPYKWELLKVVGYCVMQ